MRLPLSRFLRKPPGESGSDTGRRSGGKEGFTLVELLVVIGILLVLAGLTIPAIQSLSQSNQINAAGRLLSNLLTEARSEAINRRRMVQLRVVTNWAAEPSMNFRKLSVWMRPQADDPVQPPANSKDPFVQISKWETFPNGVIIETNDPASTTPPYNFPNAPGTYFLDSSLPNSGTGASMPGGTTADFRFIQFDSTGAVSFPGNPMGVQAGIYLLVTEGILSNGAAAVSYTHKNHPNWVQARVTSLTGRIQIVHP